ncbi:NADPH-dependent FMN reductase OS=Streptomyces cyaneofuscatus OX=66883 GN=ssuE PE=4 SV=1 [Streptomyces cyaneofuscatus]
MGAAHIVPGWFVLDRHITAGDDGSVVLDPASAAPLDQVVAQFAAALDRTAPVPATR